LSAAAAKNLAENVVTAFQALLATNIVTEDFKESHKRYVRNVEALVAGSDTSIQESIEHYLSPTYWYDTLGLTSKDLETEISVNTPANPIAEYIDTLGRIVIGHMRYDFALHSIFQDMTVCDEVIESIAKHYGITYFRNMH
jgi:uncharacterized protein YcfL